VNVPKLIASIKAPSTHLRSKHPAEAWRTVTDQQVGGVGVPGEPIASLLWPDDDDYFVLEPAHSAIFFDDARYPPQALRSERPHHYRHCDKYLCVVSRQRCFLRGYQIYVSRDRVAANTTKLTRDALTQMKTVLKAHIPQSKDLPWKGWRGSQGRRRNKAHSAR
jgi:hypothetical protein